MINVKESDVTNQNNEPVNMRDVMNEIMENRYLTESDYASDMNNVNTWFSRNNYIFGILLIGLICFVLFVPLVVISNNPVKNKPSSVKFPIQINGLSNQFMPVLS